MTELSQITFRTLLLRNLDLLNRNVTRLSLEAFLIKYAGRLKVLANSNIGLLKN